MMNISLIQKCTDLLKSNSDSAASYGSGTLGCVSGIDIAQLAGAIVIASRLLVDIPTAYDYIKARFFTKRKKRRVKGKR